MVKKIDTQKFKGIAVMIPVFAYWPELKYVRYSDGKQYYMINYYFSENHTGGFLLRYKDFGGKNKYPKEGGLTIVGKSDILTAGQRLDIVDDIPTGRVMQDLGVFKVYRNYVNDKKCLLSTSSFNSLMTSLGCDDGNYVIIKIN